jgi:hypothetical protein
MLVWMGRVEESGMAFWLRYELRAFWVSDGYGCYA